MLTAFRWSMVHEHLQVHHGPELWVYGYNKQSKLNFWELKDIHGGRIQWEWVVMNVSNRLWEIVLLCWRDQLPVRHSSGCLHGISFPQTPLNIRVALNINSLTLGDELMVHNPARLQALHTSVNQVLMIIKQWNSEYPLEKVIACALKPVLLGM